MTTQSQPDDDITLCGKQVRHQTQTATIALTLDVNGLLYALTVDHLFLPTYRAGRFEDCSENIVVTSHTEPDDEDLGSHDSDAPSWSMSLEYEDSDVSSDDGKMLQEELHLTHISSTLSDNADEAVETTGYADPSCLNLHFAMGLINSRQLTEPYLDWALVYLDSASPTFKRPNAIYLPETPMDPNFLESMCEDIPVEIEAVWIMSATRGLRQGKVLPFPVFLGAKPGVPLAEVHSVVFDDSYGVGDGECGSAVVLKRSLQIYGHIVAANPLGEAYVVPLRKTVEQIKLSLPHSESEICLPAPRNLLLEMEHHYGRASGTWKSRTADRFGLDAAALHSAIDRCNEKMICALLKAGIDPNLKFETESRTGYFFEQSPLMYAITCSDPMVALLLLRQKGVSIDQGDANGRTPLLQAAIEGLDTVIWCLLALPGIDVNARDEHGRTALSHSAELGFIRIVMLLVNHSDINLELQDTSGRVPLGYAAERKEVEIVKLLGKKRKLTPAEKQSTYDWATEIMRALRDNTWDGIETLALLLNHCCEDLVVTEDLLTEAAKNGRYGQESMKLLIEHSGRPITISEKVLEVIVQNLGSGRAIVEMLINRAEKVVNVSETYKQILIARSTNLQDILGLLFAHPEEDIVVGSALQSTEDNKTSLNIEESLMQKLSISRKRVSTRFDEMSLPLVTTGAGPSRRSHTKSRKGCKSCKRCHIRCDEGFPQCHNCTKRTVRCDYMDSITPEESREPPVADLQYLTEIESLITRWEMSGQCSLGTFSINLNAQGHHYTRNDLRLIYHALWCASHPLTSEFTIWTGKMSRFLLVAESQPFLVHAILAFGASTLAWERQSLAQKNLAYYHGGIALKGLQDAISMFSRDNVDAVLAASIVLSWQTNEWRSWSSLVVGIRVVLNNMILWRAESRLIHDIIDLESTIPLNFPNFPGSVLPVSAEQRKINRSEELRNLKEHVENLTSYLCLREEENSWNEQLHDYIMQLQGVEAAKTPEEQFNHLYTFRKWLFSIPATLLKPDTRDYQKLIVISYYYATALQLESLFPNVAGVFCSGMVVNPLQEILQSFLTLQKSTVFPHQGIEVLLALLAYPKSVMAAYNERAASRQEELEQGVSDARSAEYVNISEQSRHAYEESSIGSPRDSPASLPALFNFSNNSLASEISNIEGFDWDCPTWSIGLPSLATGFDDLNRTKDKYWSELPPFLVEEEGSWSSRLPII